MIRALLGEIEALSATGDPPGDHPDLELIVQLRAAENRRAELRIRVGPRVNEPTDFKWRNWIVDSRIRRDARAARGPDAPVVFRARNQADARPVGPTRGDFLGVARGLRGARRADLSGPSLHDATRAMELTEATARSLRKGRTVDLYYEPISEEASFKSVMTSTGCMLIIGALLIIPLALAGPPLGFNWTIYIAYLIPPLLVLFIILQTLRFAVRKPEQLRAKVAEGRK